MAEHRTAEELEAGLAHIRRSPWDTGTVELIVRRPGVDQREVLEEGRLTLDDGLVGDRWIARNTPDQSPDPDTQLTLMNARVVELLAGDKDRWPLAGDQLYVDLDLSTENLPAGTQLQAGSALIEVTAQPHTGCAKFADRFGMTAGRFVNSSVGRPLRLRGLYARVVEEGIVRRGDRIVRI